jgi:hypothetical protein
MTTVLSISFNNSVCVRIIVCKVTYSNTVRTFQLLDILYTHVFRCNWYNSLLTAGRNSSCLGLTTRDPTDTLEAITLGRKCYNFLTAGRNSNKRQKQYFKFYKNYFLISSNFKSICQIKVNSINDCECLMANVITRPGRQKAQLRHRVYDLCIFNPYPANVENMVSF